MNVLLAEGCIKEDLEMVLTETLDKAIAFETSVKNFDNAVSSFINTWQGTGWSTLDTALYNEGSKGGAIFDYLSKYAGSIAGYLQDVRDWEELSQTSASGIGGE